MGQRVHDEMSGYKEREENQELKDDYAKESSEFKVGEDVYVFKDGSQCLGTIESQEPVHGDAAKENRKKFEAIVNEAIAKLQTPLLTHSGGAKRS